MKAIVYSLFGYDRERHNDCFDFNSYLRGLLINIRMNRLIYPDWTIVLETDEATYTAFKDLFDKLPITVEVNANNTPLTLAMLWRLKPVFHTNNDGNWKYTHVLCRDLDSPPTYREAQAVQYWINKDKSMHAITDSVSHDVPLLGGMIGIRPEHFTHRMNCKTWEQIISMGSSYNWSIKGNDQQFLRDIVYPKFAQHGHDSITQHYVLGMPNSFLSDCHNAIQQMELNIPFEYKESNDVCGHIGSAGYYSTAMSKFINKNADKFEDLIAIESQHPDIFSWVKNGCY